MLFITSCKTFSIKMWFVLAAGLAEKLTQVVFRQPFVIQHVRTRFLSCETWNFLFSSPCNQLVIFDVIVFPLAAFVLFRDLSCKIAWLNPGPDLRQSGLRDILTIEAPVTSSCSVNHGTPFLWKTLLRIYDDPAGQLPCLYGCESIFIYTELSALALRRLLFKFKSWNVSTTWHYDKLESF